MEPRPYQAEAFDAARKANVVMVGATGVGKTLVSLMLIRDYYFEDASRQDSETHKWCIFLCPTQELVFQQARSAQIFTGVRCGPYVGKDLDYWGLDKWKEEMDNKDVLVMTPNALLNLLHRGTEYLSLRDVGVLVFDECHKARKKHPYARIMAFYLDLVKSGEPVPKVVFGMTASPTVECVQVLQSKAYVCEDDLIEEFQANAQWELLFYKPFAPSQTVVDELESLMRMLFSESMCGFGDSKEKFVDIVVAPVLFTYQHLGLWCAMRQIIMFCEGFLRSRVAQDLPDRSRVARTRKVVLQLIQQLLDSPLGLAVSGIERPPQPPPTNAPPDSSSKPVAAATGKDGSRGDDGIGAGSNPKSPGRNESQGGEGEGSGGGRGGGGASNGGGSGGPDGDSVSGDGGGGSLKSGVGEAGKGKGSRGSSDFAAAVAAAAAATEAAAAAAAAAVAAASKADEAGQGGGAKTVSGGSGKDPMDEDAGDGDKQSEGGEDNTKGDGGQQDVGASKNDAQQDGVGASEAGENVPRSPEAMEWGLTPSRVTTLIKTLLRVSDEWGEEAKHFRCMVFVERRATARLLSEYLSHTLKGRFSCGGLVVGQTNRVGAADACSRSKNAQTIDLFRVGEVQVLVTTDACSEGIDVPECNLVVSMDKIHTSRSLIHTRGRARSKGGKFVIMLESGEDVERDRVAVMLMEAEDIKRYQLSHEKASKRVPLRHSHPNMVHRIESTGAVVDMDMSTPLMKAALGSLGCDFQPLLIAEEITGPAMVYREKSYKCRLELPSFLGMPTIDTSSLINEHFWTKGQARAAVSFLAVVKMLGKKYIDHRLNPRRVKDRLVVETRRGYDPVLVEGREARIKAKMPVPRPVAMGILPTPAVDFDAALTAAWKAANKSRSSSNSGSGVDASAAGSTNASGGQARGESAGALPAGSAAGSSTAAAAGAAGAGDPSGGGERSGGGDSGLALGPSPPSNGNASGVGRGSTSKAEEFGEQRKEDRDGPSGEATSSAPAIDPAAAGAGYAVWEGARTRGCYENVPGPKRRMRIYCFRSPPGEVEGWVPKTKKVWRKKKPEDDGVVDKKEDGSGEGMQLEEEAEKDGEAGKDGEEGGEGEKVEEEVEEHEADMQSFHPKLKVDLGRGPGKGLGPRLFVGLASAAPLPLTATQASKLGILDSFDVDLNPAQMAAMVQWHRETVGMAALYEIPHQMTQTPQNDPAKSPFLNTGSVGDKGVLAVPVDYGDDGDGGDGVLKIDWPAIEAANAGVHLPDETEEYYTRRILFSRVSHKTCRFYFILEKTKTTLGEYLQRCLESDQGPYAGLPCETITPHDAGRMGRVEGVLAVGHGIRKPDYEAADKSQRLLLGVPAPALRHSFAQHLIRGERVMDPDAGVRSRVKVKRSKLEPSEDEDNPDDGATVGPAVAGGGSDEKAPVERSNSDGDGAVVEEGEDKDVAADPMVVDSPQASKRPASPEKAGQAAGAVTDVVTAGAAVTLEAQRMEELEEDDDGQPRGWAGVSTLKLNTHRVGPGQPVLLVEQYTQSVCCTRRVFISVLHLVPRMFDLERQLLCFVLHESLFLPALRTSLYHRTSAIDTRNGNHSSGTQSNNKTKLLLSSAADAAVTAGGDSPAITSPKEGATAPADGSGGKTAMGDGTTVATVASAPSEASQLVLLGTAAGGTATSAQAEATTETPAPTAVECTPASTSPVNDARTGADKANAGKEGARELEKAAAAAGADGTAVALETNPSTTPVSWPPHGAWCTPGEGAGTGAGPGGTGCGGGTSSSKAPPFPPLAANGLAGFGVTEIGGGAGKGVVGEAANVSGEAIAKAAATGVVQWEWGGEGAVTDTMALLDCSLRRPVNERLETLGDAWLNYYAGLVVFQDKPVLLEEGMMTLLRKNVVSNARLLKCADGRGLREFMYPPRSILGRPFDMWSPSLLPLPPPVKASRKTIADVVEALLGAALVAGGNRSAAFLMAWLGLPTLESSNDPEKAKEAAAANTPAGDPPEGEKEGVSGSGAVGEAGLETSPTAEAGAEGTSSTSGAAAALAAAPTCGRVGELSAAAAASAAGSAAALLEKEAGSGPKRIRARGGGWLLARGGAGSSGSGDSSTELSVEARPDPMDEEEVSGGGGDGGSEFEAASSPKRKGSSSEGDDLMPSLKRVRTPEEEPGDAASDAMELADGTAAGVAAKGDGAREEPEEEETEDTKEDATEDDDDEGPDSGDEGGGAVTDAAAAAGAARAAKRAAALAGAGEVPSGTGVDPEAASNAVGEGDGGGGNSGGDVVSGGDGDAAGVRTRKKPLCKRAQLRDHIPEVDERTRPWLWNPPDYMWGDPGRFGGGYGVGDAGLGGRGVGGRRADSSGLSRRDGKDVPGVHARAGGESFAFSSASGRCGGGSGDYASRSLTAATAMMHNSGSGGGGGGGGGVSADPSPPEAASGTPAASERQGGATPVHALASAGVEPAQAANPAAMEVDADVNDAQAKGINAHGSGAVVGPSCSGHKAQGGANGSGKATGDDTGAAKEGIGRDRDGAGTNGPGGEADAKQGEESGAGSSAGAGAVAAAAPNEARKTTEKTAAPKWVGLCLEGMKGSARWPIRKEPLMSAEYLAEAGVLPKVYVKTRPSARLMGNIRRLEKRLGYTFRYPWLCMQAITHPSWTMFDRNWNSSVKPTAIAGGIDRLMEKTLDGGSVEGISSHDIPPGTVPAQDYQRLEFLGDAVLGWMVTAHLYFASSDFTPAELTRIKSSCVCNASLWVIAIRLDVHHVLRASPKILGNIHAFIQNNEIHSGCTPPKHPADVLEALIAAVYLDSSCCMDTVSQVFWPLIAQYLQDYPPPAADEMDGGGGSTTRGSAVGDMAVRAPASVAPAPAAAPASTPAPASAAAEAPTEESATAGGVEATSTTSVGDVSAALQDKASATDLPAPQAAAAADDISAGGTAARASDSDVGMGEGANGQVGGADLSVAGVSDAGIGSGASRDGRGGADVGVCPSPDGVCDGFVCEACEAAEANDDGGGALGAGLGVAPMAVEGADAGGENKR
ncbi:unnamed protein product [Scytosiphon promiscuus]